MTVAAAHQKQRAIPLAAVLLLLFGIFAIVLPTSNAERTATGLKRSATKGQRKKGWRRRAEDWDSLQDRNHNGGKSTIVTNPSTLGKGKGGDGTYVYNSEDDNGRTTFVIKCHESRAYKKAMGDKVVIDKGIDKKVGSKGDTGGANGESVEPKTPTTKVAPEDVCDEYYSDGSGGDAGRDPGGGWVSGGDGDSGTGEGGYEQPTDGGDNGVEYPVEEVSGNDGSESENGVGGEGMSACPQIAAGNGPARGNSVQYEVKLDVIKESELPTAGILQLMKADLQFNVAPAIADCTESGGGYGTNGDTGINDVRFQDLSKDEGGCSSDYFSQAESLGGECIRVTIPVDLYYDGDDTSGYYERVEEGINNHEWNVPGLMQTSPVQSDTSGINAVEQQEAQADDKALGPAGYLTLAAAALVLVLLAVMLARRRRREEMVKHVELGEEDDDETYLRDMESNGSSPNRLARVVGEDDSIQTGWTGHTMGGATNAYFSNAESRPSHQDVHICSSATCEICEQNRQSGVQFIPSGTNITHPPMPPDSPRQYSADDTVQL